MSTSEKVHAPELQEQDTVPQHPATDILNADALQPRAETARVESWTPDSADAGLASASASASAGATVEGAAAAVPDAGGTSTGAAADSAGGGATGPASEDAVIEAIATVHDPEIPVNIYELGLIYAIDLYDDGRVKIEMTLTAPNCPSAQELPVQVKEAVEKVSGVASAQVEVVWDPPWDMSRMSDEARLALNMF
ncbi:metal-sulfur cluster biosynthesis protein [Acetobacter persici]|uniref:SUF system Fe-S cluster assembly protein n=1 Tax=Acetobacter persici TaxID=1076596 RepID=UPI000B6867EF|nr:SUF system Fe-S cluster assembly protein [Acetobacter persici]OUI90436.1 metal-sulfur cluster biosynthesis protein [Acetobacter persici]